MSTKFTAGALDLTRCPHCNVASPLLSAIHGFETRDSTGVSQYKWRIYCCSRCGMPLVGGCLHFEDNIRIVFPDPQKIGDALPPKPLAFLRQAVESVHAPSGAIMLCASAVDAMLKDKGFKTGSLYARIEEAASKHLITAEMAKWAHEVRLDANDERHADETAGLPVEADAKRCIDFTKALAEFLFILPARVQRGLSESAPKKNAQKK